MQHYTKKEKIAKVAEHYKLSYPTNKKLFDGRWTDDVHQELLDKKPTTEREVAAILGNTSWTDLMCDNCGCNVEEVILIDDRFDTHTIFVCGHCIKTANLKLNCRREVKPEHERTYAVLTPVVRLADGAVGVIIRAHEGKRGKYYLCAFAENQLRCEATEIKRLTVADLSLPQLKIK